MTSFDSGWVAFVFACVPALSAGAWVNAKGDEPREPDKLSLTKPVLCKEIRGYEDYEERADEEGEYFHLVTLWKSTKQERKKYEEG